MDRQTQMGVFVEVVRAGSFSEAARNLHITPSAVSKQISALEDRLGTRLFNRTTRRLHLSEAGERYFARSRRILDDIEEAEADISQLSGSPRGVLKVNAPVVFGSRQLSALIPEFQELYPDVEVRLTLTDRLVDLIEEGDDVALRTGQLRDSSLMAKKLAPIRRIVCASPGYIKKHGAPQVPDDLLKHNCLTWSEPDHMNEWPFTGCPDRRVIKVRGNFSCNDGEALMYAALNDHGIVRLASFILGNELRRGTLIPVLNDYVAPSEANLFAVFPPSRYVVPKVRVFVDFLAQRFSPEPPWDCH